MARKTSLVILLCSLVLVVGLAAGMAWQRDTKDPNGPLQQMGIMVEVYEHVKTDYVTTPNMAKVSSGALHGLLDSLDADSSYLDPAQYQAFLQDQQHPPAADVGAVFSKRVGYADVVDVQPGGPAAKAGLVRGDFVEAIGAEGTRDMSMAEIDHLLGGSPGSTVTMGVVHLHQSDPVQITITRAAPARLPLRVSEQGAVGIIGVPDFSGNRAAQIAAAVRRLKGQGAHAFVLDLRNCGAGAYADAALAANVFLDHGTITYLQGQRYPRVTTTADAAHAVDATDPLEVVVNFGTSGPAEAVAAALQQNGRAKLVGDHSFGEGSLQKLIPVGDGSAIWLTVARYFTPKGQPVQDGLAPDVEQVQYAGALPDLDYRPEGVTGPLPDLQLQKALQLVSAAGQK